MNDSTSSLPEGFLLHRYDTIGSTNDEAKALARAGAPDGTLVWAEEQTAGRGRRGRLWQSPPGNLYLSLVLRPDGRELTRSVLPGQLTGKLQYFLPFAT